MIVRRPRARVPITTRGLLAALLTLTALGADGPTPAPPGQPEPPWRVPGRFGQALDARHGGFVAPANPRYGQLPLTVELWARLGPPAAETVLLSNESRVSGTHWELSAARATGRLGLRLNGARPADLAIDAAPVDGQWHHIALVLEPARARAFVDGRLALDAPLAWAPGPSHPSGLGVGTRLEDRHPSAVQLDDVRISARARDLVAAPETALVADEHTLGLWSFDESEAEYLAKWTPGGETNQRGLPYPQRIAEFEFETDANWIDGRWQQTDKGPFLTHSIVLPQRATGPKTTAVFADPERTTALLYDLERCTMIAGVAGARIATDAMRYGLLRRPTLEGSLQFYVPPVKAWRRPAAQPGAPLMPVERSELDYQGLHLQGARVLLTARVLGGEVLESASVERAGGLLAVARHLQVSGLNAPALLTLAEMPTAPTVVENQGRPYATTVDGEAAHAVAVIGEGDSAPALRAEGQDVLLPFTPGAAWRGTVLAWSGRRDQLEAFAALVRAAASPAPDLNRLREPGPRRWGDPIVTRGHRAEPIAEEPYVVDTVAVPYANPFGALFFISALDFFADGAAALGTAHGDVWIVRGLDDGLEHVTWQRFATGLYQPLGLKVVDGKVIVLGRDQLTRLHDTNGDGEADFYESFNHDLIITGRDHAFAMRLETDPSGNFYFLNSGDPGTPHGSSLLRVGPDGRGLEIVARGFRHPYGLGVGPHGEVTVADNEGNWVPSSKIDWVRPGGFYGYLADAAEPPAEVVPDRPLCYIPKVADNSCGGQTWVTSERWGPEYRGEMLHLSWGRCTLFAVLQQVRGDQRQAAVVRFPGLTFLSGSGEAAFHPVDGQLYVVGLDGWQTGAVADGSFQRVRYTGRPVRMPRAVAVHENGVRIEFSTPLDPATAVDPRNYRAEWWNYRWSGTYGSFHYSVAQPDLVREDPLPITSATLLPGGRAVFLAIPGLKAVDQYHIATDLRSADGRPLRFDLHGTINFLAEALDPGMGSGPSAR